MRSPLSCIPLIFLLSAQFLRAINVGEGADFSNTSPGTAFSLDSGTNTFSGVISTPSDGRDYFRVTVPAGKRITSVSKTVTGGSLSGGVTFNNETLTGTGTASFIGTGGAFQLLPGTYDAMAYADFSTGSSWSITITVGNLPNYTVLTTGGAISVTDDSGNSDTLTLSEPVAGSIRFAATSRTFTIDGGALLTGDSGNISYTGKTSINVSPGAGSNVINVGGFTSAAFPSLSISGGSGDDTINFNGDLTFASGRGLSSNLGSAGVDSISLAAGANLIATGTGTISLKCSRNISLGAGASLETLNGDLTVEANQQTTATTGSFNGVALSGTGTLIRANGSGAVTVKGRGGNDAGGYQLGIDVENGAKIIGGTSAALNVVGTGGASSGIVNRGVTVLGANSAITSLGAPVAVTGTAGASGGDYGIGVSVLFAGEISAGGTSSLTVTGTGAGVSGGNNQGLEIGSTGTILKSGGNLSLLGKAGSTGGYGLLAVSDASLSLPTGTGTLSITTESLSLDSSCTVTTTNPGSSVAFFSSVGTNLDLGGSDASGVLGLSDAELDRVTTPRISFSNLGANSITISSPITRSTATNFTLAAGTAGLFATAGGTDLSLSGGTLTLAGLMRCPISTVSGNPSFPGLVVDGLISVSGALDLSGSNHSGGLGQSITLVQNDLTDPTTGTFTDLPEGGYIAWPGNGSLTGKISYAGGAGGNDVVISLVPVAEALVVTTLADTGPGCLRNVMALAAATPGPHIISFSSALSGGTISLTSKLTITDSGGITLDASSLPGGITINGGPSPSFGLLQVAPGTGLTLIGLTLANGNENSTTYVGGAILNEGTLVMKRCTLSGNSSTLGGAIYNLGSAELSHCTLSGNTSISSVGSAIYNANTGTLTLIHCTVTANIGTAIWNDDFLPVTFANTIISGNSAVSSPDVSGNTQGTGNLIGGSALLSPLADNGGPTRTCALQTGSPAINAAIPIPGYTTDQRGLPISRNGNGVGGAIPDIGAYELQSPLIPESLANSEKTIVVTTTADEDNPNGMLGTGISLREAIRLTPSGGGILFDRSLNGQSLAPTSQLTLAKNLVIDASTLSSGLGLKGGFSHRIFKINAACVVRLLRLAMTECSISGGYPNGYGGALYNDGTLTLIQCTLAGNTGFAGGALYNTSSLTIQSCTFSNNAASYGGAIQNENTTYVSSSTFTGNTASVEGGAFSSPGSPLTLTHSTVYGNSAGKGGASIGSNLTVSITILVGNTAPTDPNISGTYTAQAQNILSGDPKLNSLGDYGGPTRTMSLQAGSPAINAGTSSIGLPDQRGVAANGVRDIGAYEIGTTNTDYNSWIVANLPGTATASQRAASFDFDGDGISNYNEWIAGTYPGDPTSRFNTSITPSGPSLVFLFPTATSRTYRLQQSDDLGTWINTPGQVLISGTGSTFSITLGKPAVAKRFYRIQAGNP